MKLVIEIPNEVVDKESYVDYFGCFSRELYEIIKNGTPLNEVFDEIRAEIDKRKSTIDKAISEDELKIDGMKEAYTDCLEIINKYREEQE